MDQPLKSAADAPLSNATVAFGVALGITGIANAVLVIAKEKSPALMAAMKATTGHHWVTQSAAALALFLVLGLGLMRVNGGQGLRMTSGVVIKCLVGGLALGTALIAGFYLFGD